MAKIRIGMMGAGFIGNIHLGALKQIPEVEVVAVASSQLETARQFAGAHNIPHAYADFREMIASRRY